MDSESDDLRVEMNFIDEKDSTTTAQPKSAAVLNESLSEDKELPQYEE